MAEKRPQSSSRDGRDHRDRDDSKSNSFLDDPPMSRLFIICNKSNTEDEFRNSFDKFGNLEEVWVVKDKNTGENKGVVYIKFSKTSEAARALEEMNGKMIGNHQRPIKVLVASNRMQGSKKFNENENEKYIRLFVIVPKDMTENELTEEFERFGELDSINIIRDKNSGEKKGFAYVKYHKFSDAAVAFENCDRRYRAVFAEPKPTRSSDSFYNDSFSSNFSGSSRRMSNSNEHERFSIGGAMHSSISNIGGASSGNAGGGNCETTLNIICSSQINQDQLWRLFDIIPGLDYCQISGECSRNGNFATVVYNNPDSAAYAREKLHGLEYPLGERLIVKTVQDSKPMGSINPDGIFPFDSSRDMCNVPLPPPAPMAPSTMAVAQRCFIVCVSHALPIQVLRNIFSRFGDLIDVYLLPNKNCGYAKYGSESSCRKAIETLHGAEICGIRIKVMEAEELPEDRRKRFKRD